jgi:ABC-2 type transport system ATP-binding protein
VSNNGTDSSATEGEDAVLKVRGLTKRFKVRRPMADVLRRPFAGETATVVSDVSFFADAGEFFGLLGPNGAGKTTLLKMLSTLIIPDEGTAEVDGYDVVHHAETVRALTSPCLATERSLYHRLTARQNIEVFADLEGIPRAERATRVDEVLRSVSLTDTGSKLVGQFSSGMLQRLLIARALLPRPRLLLLDEPTRSLDPVSAREFRAFLRNELARERNCAVILATHNAEEAFELCDRVGVLNRGRLLASGSARVLAREFIGIRYRVVTTTPAHAALTSLSGNGVSISEASPVDGSPSWFDVTLKMKPDHDPSAVLAELSQKGVRIAAFELVRPSLADLIEEVVKQERRS